MSQEEVLKVLEKEDRWMTPEEISKKVKIGNASLKHNLKRLKEGGFILCQEENQDWRKPGRIPYLYRAK